MKQTWSAASERYQKVKQESMLVLLLTKWHYLGTLRFCYTDTCSISQ